jgi:FMNH2-dependent dimethyl sulfone monooxygenase
MRYGYWMPVFGGWLRNVPDEGMEATWDEVCRLARRSEAIGYDLTLIAELFLNDIKGIAAPSLEAWSTAAALAAVTQRLEVMIAVRPTFHPPAILAKQAATLDQISGGRVALNVVSSWWADEARRYGVQFDTHDDRYARTEECGQRIICSGLAFFQRAKSNLPRFSLCPSRLTRVPSNKSSSYLPHSCV